MLHPEDEDQGYILEIPHANQLALYGALGWSLQNTVLFNLRYNEDF